MSLVWEPKDPKDKRLFYIDFGPDLNAGDSVTGADWTVSPEGLTLGNKYLEGSRAYIWIDGGAAGSYYWAECQAETDQGEIINRRARFYVTDL